jgi:hypothetical protein
MIDSRTLEHVPEKLIDFSDENILQLFDFEHLLLARVIQPEPKMLESIISRKTAGAVPSSPLAESCLSCRTLARDRRRDSGGEKSLIQRRNSANY